MWAAVALSSLACFLIKYAGYTIPESVLERRSIRKASVLLPVGLLTALAATQMLAVGDQIVLDSRVLGVGAALVAVRLRAPFLVVVVVAALLAALGRLAGLP